MVTPLPLHTSHERLGAKFGEADGYLLPLHYGDPAAEHAAVRERVGLVDRSHRGTIAVTGRDRVEFLQGMLSNDVKALSAGQGCPAAFLDAHAKIVSLLVVHCQEDRFFLETDHLRVAPTLATLDRFLFRERVELEDASGAHGILTLAGPSARKVVEEILGHAIPDLSVYHHASLEWAGHEIRVAREEESGEEGYNLRVPADGLARLWGRAIESGSRPVGREAWNILRVEAGVVWHGADVDASTLLVEAPLEGTYSLTKGCYIGQEVLARVTYRGHVNRKIVGFIFVDERIPPRGAAIRVQGQEVGRITSAVVSPLSRRGLALGFLRREHWEPGTRVEVAGEAETLSAEVAGLPFYRRTPFAP